MNFAYLKELTNDELRKEFSEANHASIEYKMILQEIRSRQKDKKWPY